MKNSKIAGTITAAVGISALVSFLNSNSSEPIINWPLEAYLGAAFTIGWLTGVPNGLAYVLGGLVFIVMAWVCYQLGSGVYRLVTRPKR